MEKRTEEIAEALFQEAEKRRVKGKPLMIAIDGRCAAGKTTLAACLQERYGCKVIHMDHFFLRPKQRTKARLSEPGGNIDYERFLAEVLEPLKKGVAFSYRPYDCKTGTFSAPVTIEPGEMTVVEGSYACHPQFREAYDLRVFLTVEKEEQLRRIEKRNGTEQAAVFKEKWIPLEEAYFSACDVEKACVLLYETT